MDMDRDSLELMLNLLDTDCNIKTALEGHRELAKNKQKVKLFKSDHPSKLNIEGDWHLHGDEGRWSCWKSQHWSPLSWSPSNGDSPQVCSVWYISSKVWNLSAGISAFREFELNPTLLFSMTSKRAGEWFKEELRELGGLGHLARFRRETVWIH